MAKQMPLHVVTREPPTLDNFYVGDERGNALLVNQIKHLVDDAGESMLYVWGGQGVGVTHLMKAAVSKSRSQQQPVLFLPLANSSQQVPEHLLEMAITYPMVVIDDLDAVIGNRSWEEALFALFNHHRDSGGRILFGAHAAPDQLDWALPDLKTRVGWHGVYRIADLTENDKQQFLVHEAKRRGLELADDVAQFIMVRAPRGLDQLNKYLDILDEESLAHQRGLSIPFVKKVFGW